MNREVPFSPNSWQLGPKSPTKGIMILVVGNQDIWSFFCSGGLHCPWDLPDEYRAWLVRFEGSCAEGVVA